MRYTKEMLMPKRWPNNNPNDGEVRHVYDDVRFGWTLARFDKIVWANRVTWWIDIPDAPPEVRPQAYPANKPSKNGNYIVHFSEYDEWAIRGWDKRKFEPEPCWMTGNDVDYFIDIPLESEEKASDVICVNCQQISSDYNKLRLAGDQLAEAAIRVVGEYDGLHRLRLAISEWAKVTASESGREPELLPCPNPECGESCAVHGDNNIKEYQVVCGDCEYHSPLAYTPAEAIRLHNMIAKNAIPYT